MFSFAQHFEPPHNGGTKIDCPAPTLEEGIAELNECEGLICGYLY